MAKLLYVRRRIAELDRTTRPPVAGDLAFAMQQIDRKPPPVLVSDDDIVLQGHDLLHELQASGADRVLTVSETELRRVAHNPSPMFNFAEMYALHLRAQLTPISSLWYSDSYFPPAFISQCATTVRTRGFQLPTFVDGLGRIAFSEPHVRAAASLGMPTVPTLCVSELDADEKAKFRFLMKLTWAAYKFGRSDSQGKFAQILRELAL